MARYFDPTLVDDPFEDPCLYVDLGNLLDGYDGNVSFRVSELNAPGLSARLRLYR